MRSKPTFSRFRTEPSSFVPTYMPPGNDQSILPIQLTKQVLKVTPQENNWTIALEKK